ncbi:hypothetical protein ACU686_43485 [Yinghuangia aomiensis]
MGRSGGGRPEHAVRRRLLLRPARFAGQPGHAAASVEPRTLGAQHRHVHLRGRRGRPDRHPARRRIGHRTRRRPRRLARRLPRRHVPLLPRRRRAARPAAVHRAASTTCGSRRSSSPPSRRSWTTPNACSPRASRPAC